MTHPTTRYLLFTLTAPLASFGTVAVGERRPTWDRPSKSQIIGLVAGCLGIERVEEERQRELAASLGFAVRVDDPGTLATDYHTAQAAKDVSIRKRIKAGFTVDTRAEELACDDLKTILSRREFRVGSHYTVALWKSTADGADLDTIAQALRTPVFAPFAGRKAHALMLPMRPLGFEATSIERAFADFDERPRPDASDLLAWLGYKPAKGGPIYVDATAIPEAERDRRVARIEQRRDIPESRAKWRFGLRNEALLKPANSGGRS
jgi:CRISPR system Cascade subunit CasD